MSTRSHGNASKNRASEFQAQDGRYEMLYDQSQLAGCVRGCLASDVVRRYGQGGFLQERRRNGEGFTLHARGKSSLSRDRGYSRVVGTQRLGQRTGLEVSGSGIRRFGNRP